MTATALPLRPRVIEYGTELTLPLPYDHQLPMMNSDARFKVGRWGRRSGKTTLDFFGATAGHGPGWENHQPMFPGILQGWDVVWIAKDYPQAKAVWEAEIEPRFRGLKGVRMTQTPERMVSVQGGGTLHIRSGERKPIAGIRGLGKRVKGVICDEAAHWDLRYGWQKVLRPVLMDNAGWAIITSTTNKASDGGVDDETGNVVVPSYFNRLCAAILAQEKGRTRADGWEHFYATAKDNPRITPAEFQALLNEYVAGSLAESEEVYAKLLTGGAGLAFHEWREDLHVARYEPPAGWRWFGGLDWGYRNPCALIFFAAGPDGDILARHEIYVKGKTPFEVGYLAGQKAQGFPGRVEWIGSDSAMWAVTDGGPSIAEDFQRGLAAAANGQDPIPLISAPKGPGSRAARVQILHDHLHYDTIPAGFPLPGGAISDGTIVPPWAGPKLRFHPDCANAIRTIPALPIDPKNSEDVDTEAEDHAYDGVTYGLQCRVPRPVEETHDRVPDDVHPGFQIDPASGKARRKPRWETEPEPELARRALLGSGHFVTGVRVGGARPVTEE